jgi:hypothetical protein
MPVTKGNMKVADAVLAIIESLLSDEVTFYCEPYQNGREHGWSLYDNTMTRQVCFSEYRNSDSIVVYAGTPRDFSMQGNTPNDKVYHESRSFSYDEHYEAAKFILDYLPEKA